MECPREDSTQSSDDQVLILCHEKEIMDKMNINRKAQGLLKVHTLQGSAGEFRDRVVPSMSELWAFVLLGAGL